MMRGILRKAVLGALALLLAGLVTWTASAQSGGRIFLTTRVATNQTGDGIVLARAVNAPVRTLDGQVVATANVTSVVAHPTMEYWPTVIDITAGGARVVVSELTSRDGTFRRTYGFDNLTGTQIPITDASVLIPPGETDDISSNPLLFFLSLSRANLLPTSPTTLSHAFRFTQNRVDRLVGDTGLSFRPGIQWTLVPAPGQQVRVGDNPSVSFVNVTNPTQQASVNFLRLPDQQSGAIVTCVGPAPLFCGLAGVGDYNGIYGTAASRTPGSLGVSADAASDTVLTHVDRSVPPNPPGCPPGALLPPPANLMGGVAGLGYTFIWDSVECAATYAVRLRLSDGGTILTRIDRTKLFRPFGGLSEDAVAFSVASVGQDGRQGPFSAEQPVIHP